MMGSMMADLKGFHGAVNASLRAQGKSELTLDQLMVMLFREVEYVWPRLGYPPLVTPFSQYVKNTALMNLMNILKGQPRWSTIDKDTWNMILGRMGKLPGELDPEIVALAAQKGLEFYEGNPQDEFPDELDEYCRMMEAEGWDRGQDDEELFEFAMHERQYRDYKSGLAKERFMRELEAARIGRTVPVQAPVKGQMLWQLDVTDVSAAPVAGTKVKAGEVIGYVQTYYGLEEVVSAADGVLVVVSAHQGTEVAKGETIARIEKL
jgi:pyruvate carboxylase subunit B